jgi:alpha-N-arabinofuranosidase
MFGSFIEHLGRALYDEIHEPGHPSADEHGFRADVKALVKELGVSAIRCPGGNFVYRSLQTGWTRWCNERFEKVDKIHGVDNWPVAPHLAEDAYTVADAVVVGNLLISLPKRADRVTSASLAQLVHVIAPIMTEPGGIAWRQTTFFPFASTSAHATGAVVTMRLEFDLDTLGEVTAASAQTLADGDAYATNTLTEPERVVMRTNVSLTMSGRSCSLELPRVFWTVITVCCAPPHP